MVTVENSALGAVATSVIVDHVVVVDSGSINAVVGGEAVAWFKFTSAFDGKAVDAGTVSLSGGFNAVWNLNASRWEYGEIQLEREILLCRLLLLFGAHMV